MSSHHKVSDRVLCLCVAFQLIAQCTFLSLFSPWNPSYVFQGVIATLCPGNKICLGISYTKIFVLLLIDKYLKYSQIVDFFFNENQFSVESIQCSILKPQSPACIWVNVLRVCFLAQSSLNACSRLRILSVFVFIVR